MTSHPTTRKRIGQESLKNIEKSVRIKQSQHFIEALKTHKEQCDTLFNDWKERRDAELVTQKRFSKGIITFAIIQFLVVFGYAVFCVVKHPATPLEILGLVTLICSQTFGLVFVVAKYIFGSKPDGLNEISRFISETRPQPPAFNKKNNNKQL